MISRETLELEPVAVPEEKRIGVIGVSPGAGATTICGLLERENRFRGKNVRILDLGEKKEPDCRLSELSRLVVVADGREGALPEGVGEMMRMLQESGTETRLVVNRRSPPPSPSVTPPPEGEARYTNEEERELSPNSPSGEARDKFSAPPPGELSAKQTEGDARVIYIPELDLEAFTALYNFAFYS